MIIAVIITVFILALLSLTTSAFAWLPRKKDEEVGEVYVPPLSVIIMVHDDVDLVQRNIPLLLGQEYGAPYEIILVTNEGDTVADDLMKMYMDEPRLRYTFIPNTSRYVSHDKLGVTLGVKAATNEWCLLINGNSYPTSSRWLHHIGKACTEERNIVMGFCNYDNDSKMYQRLYRLRHYCQLWKESNFMPVFASNLSNLCFRKSEFIGNDGFRGNLDVMRGEYDFIVNKYSKKESTGFVTEKEAMLTETAPTTKQWNSQRKYYLYSCSCMNHRYLHRLLPCLDAMLIHATVLGCLAVIIAGSLFSMWPIAAAGGGILLFEWIMRGVIAKNVIEDFDAQIPIWLVFPLETISVFHTFADKLRLAFSNKLDFTCHKL